MKFVSIGPCCDTADILKHYNLRTEAYPFDYIFSTLEMIKHCISDKFNIFLDKKYYIKGDHDSSTKHQFYCNYLNSQILRYHIIDGYDVSKINLFNHHDLIENKEHYEQFVRRCNRLLNLLQSDEKVVFVYHNRYTININDIIDFSNYFSGNKNIYVVGIYENCLDKRILYESENCKIYQNYDKTFLFDEIKSLNLKK